VTPQISPLTRIGRTQKSHRFRKESPGRAQLKCKLSCLKSHDGMQRRDCWMSGRPPKNEVLLLIRGALPVSMLGDQT